MDITASSQTEFGAGGKCDIVHNSNFGGAAKLSKVGLDAYNQIRIVKNLPIIEDLYLAQTRASRIDPDLVEVVRSLGPLASRSGSLIVESIPVEYAGCFHIREYDGGETVVYDTSDLIAYTLKSYQPDCHSNEENVALLKRMIELARNPIVDDEFFF